MVLQSARRGYWRSRLSNAFMPLTYAALAILFMLACGCSLTPRDLPDEQAKLDLAAPPFEPPVEERHTPDLPPNPTWRDVLQRAFLANGDLEAAYFDWKAALQRVEIAGAWPNSNVQIGYAYAFPRENLSTFDRMTFSVGFDSSMNLSWPTKTQQEAKVALDQARTAGERFRVAKFDLQRKVLYAWADYTLQAQTLALRKQDLTLRRMLVESTTAQVQTGLHQSELVAAQLGLDTAENEWRDLLAQHEATRTMLNSLMERESHAPLAAPDGFGPPRPVPIDNISLLNAAADVFPEVSIMASEVEGRRDALELARLRWIPDVNPSVVFTGSVMQAIGAGVMLPTTIVQIRGSINEAQSMLRASQATLRQRKVDRIGEYVNLLIMLRNAQRRAAFFKQTILPAAKRVNDLQSRAYESGVATLTDVVESRRVLLDSELIIAEANAAIEKAIVDIECCLGADIETISPATHPSGGESL